MKTAIKKRIESLLNRYKEVTNAYLAEIKKWEKDSLYANDYRQDKIRELKGKMKANDNDFNNQLVKVITDEKENITNSTVSKPSDYQGQITNALEFIKLSGDKITDELAFDMVKPFQGDYPTMKLFEMVLRNQAAGMCNATLTRLRKFEYLKSRLAELENAANDFFDVGYYITTSLGYALRESVFVGVMDEVQSIVEYLNSEMALNFKQAEKDAEDEVKDEMGA